MFGSVKCSILQVFDFVKCSIVKLQRVGGIEKSKNTLSDGGRVKGPMRMGAFPVFCK